MTFGLGWTQPEGIALPAVGWIRLVVRRALHHPHGSPAVCLKHNKETTWAVVKIRAEKNSCPYGIWAHYLCDTGAVLYRHHRGHGFKSRTGFIFSGLIFTTAKIAFIFASLSAVHINDFQTFTVKALALLFVRWMVGGRVNLKITIIPVDNDGNNNNNNNNNNNDNNITLDHNIYNDELMIVMNFLFLLFTLCSSRGSAPYHRKFVMQNSCPQLRSHTNV